MHSATGRPHVALVAIPSHPLASPFLVRPQLLTRLLSSMDQHQ
jgi:hypothetical protein